MPVRPLAAERLLRRFAAERLPFQSTRELGDGEPLELLVGQFRAVEALRFGAGMRREGYNLFAMGSGGLGKRSVVLRYLQALAPSWSTPEDWCYVNDFADENRPKALRLPSGEAEAFRDAVRALIEELREDIPAAFLSKGYRESRSRLDHEFEAKQAAALEEVERRAKERDMALVQTPLGVGVAPVRDGEAMDASAIAELPDAEKRRIEEDVEALQLRLKEALATAREHQRALRERVRELNRDLIQRVVEEPLSSLRARWLGEPGAALWLEQLGQDVVEHAQVFIAAHKHHRAKGDLDAEESEQGLLEQLAHAPSFRRYEVNVVVTHRPGAGAPVVVEEHPSAGNLIGRIEYQAQLGNLTTDLTLIRPGALHRANGGWLVLDARSVLMHPFAWEELKRVLRARELKIETLRELVSPVSTVGLQPQPIPLDVKVVLLGERGLLHLMGAADPDFEKLFKVQVDFEERMERSDENALRYARLIAHLSDRDGLLPFDRGAVARVVEHGSRVAGDAEKLSTHLLMLGDLAREADYFAREAGRPEVSAPDVEQAIDAQLRRSGRLDDLLQEEIFRGTYLIDTTGARVGQVNGLSVLNYGGRSFGRPMRITARIRLGGGRVLDIERESKLGGPIHSKGVLILAGYLGGRYVEDLPLSLAASLVFEQSYVPVEGDSATLAELCALLSATAGLPLLQSIALTGSVNQHGDVQPVGGINEKIESFFDVCRHRGLDGTQGVIIPAANVRHLMLRADVVAAAGEGRFRVWPVRTVDEAMELLTGRPAGGRDAEGQYPEGSVNALVEARLVELAERARSFRVRREGDREAGRNGDES